MKTIKCEQKKGGGGANELFTNAGSLDQYLKTFMNPINEVMN